MIFYPLSIELSLYFVYLIRNVFKFKASLYIYYIQEHINLTVELIFK